MALILDGMSPLSSNKGESVMVANGPDGDGGRRAEASEEEDRDVPLLLAIAAKLIFMGAVLWFVTPHPMH